MKRKEEVHNEAAKGAVPQWVGWGWVQKEPRRLLTPMLNGIEGRREGVRGEGGRVKGS